MLALVILTAPLIAEAQQPKKGFREQRNEYAVHDISVPSLLKTRHQPRSLLHMLQFVEDFLYLPGVIAILLGHTRVTRHGHAPVVIHTLGSIIGASGWVVSSILPSTSILYAVHIPTGKMGTRPL